MSATDDTSERRSKAQSYFDRYPERKGQGPYIPKAKLVHSTSSKSVTKDVKAAEKCKDQKQIEKPEKPICESRAYLDSIHRSRARRDREDTTDSVRQWHSRSSDKSGSSNEKKSTDSTFIRAEGAPTLKEVRSRVNHAFPASSNPKTTSLSNSSSSLPPQNITRNPRAEATLEANADATNSEIRAARSWTVTDEKISSGLPSSSFPNGKVAALTSEFENSRKFDVHRPRKADRNRGDVAASTPSFFPQDYGMSSETSRAPLASSIPPKRATDDPSLQRKGVPTIDDIIRRNTPTLDLSENGTVTILQTRSSPPFERRPSGNTIYSCSSGEASSRYTFGKKSSGEASDRYTYGKEFVEPNGGEESDSSLDSVEREIQNSLKFGGTSLSRSSGSQDRKTIASVSPALQATFTGPALPTKERARSPLQSDHLERGGYDSSVLRPHHHLMIPSASAPILSHKKSTPTLKFSTPRSPHKHKRVGSRHNERSFSDVFGRQYQNGANSGQDSDTSSGLNVPIIHRSKSSADLTGGMRKALSPLRDKKNNNSSTSTLPPVPQVPSKHANAQKVQTSSPYETNEAKMIRRYVYSNRLTQLLTLSRLPYAGKTVSFADVGNANGHVVIIFMGLGAVRYLIGLYDEMASALGLRLICIDRWGMGKTDDLPSDKRGVLEWSNVVAEVTDRLAIRKFSVLAHSAGAPYAMATTLMHSERLVGPVHLLAPWVSPVIESGYKWLRYVPDGVIKTAQAAEWRMQGWKLGVGTRPSTASGDDVDLDTSCLSQDGGHDISPEDHSFERYGGSFTNSTVASTAMFPQRSFDSALSTSSSANAEVLTGSSYETSPTATSVHTINHNTAGLSRSHKSHHTYDRASSSHQNSPPSRSSMSSLAEHYDILNAWQAQLGSEDSDRLPLPPPKTPTKDRLGPGAALGSAYSPSSNASPHANNLKTSPNATVDLPTELLRASHAESGGSSHDLLVILGRSSQKPWGFAYTDVDHPVRVWYGDKDERISMSSILWMEREMRDCQVTFVKNANHSLMTNVSVVVEALESIASCYSSLT
ncbi:alpha/beta-hydrolase [Meira miltonrushii]|uniref:Alpha/beta-hydrolase n=1 Tax=Meira miltonrushii TaxID=1280837 RepID=A0A316VC89_9BASI|nr:alpha/beta-hydrolase [Meira miltonrushii]PWN34914.1 alpha/beta-hydrolase [Meira miltonrushii]